MDEEELYRLMNEEDELYLGDSKEETAPSKKLNIFGCFGMFILAGILISFFCCILFL